MAASFVALLSLPRLRAAATAAVLFLSAGASCLVASSLTVPVREGTVRVTRDDGRKEFEISYALARPMSLSSAKAAPIVVLHGGPSVPSDYLYPLADVVPYRSILFFDQLGCGRSDEPDDAGLYGIEEAVGDLRTVLEKLSVRRFHLYGQSFGGILAYEYLKKMASLGGDSDDDDQDGGCLSVVISSSPTSVRVVEEEAQKLIEALDGPELFRETHQCRTPGEALPGPLAEAYEKAGTVWRGTDAIKGYEAEGPDVEGKGKGRRSPSAMVMRGEHDFVTEKCCEGWRSLFADGLGSRSVRYKTLEGCSHHGLLEDGPRYGELLDSFFAEYD